MKTTKDIFRAVPYLASIGTLVLAIAWAVGPNNAGALHPYLGSFLPLLCWFSGLYIGKMK